MNELKETKGTTLQHEYAGHYERLEDGVMVRLLSGVGNHANKAILLAAMKPDVVYGQSGENSAGNLLRNVQSDDPRYGWHQDYNTPYNYFVKSMAPVGVVAKEVIDEVSGKIGYKQTEIGRTIGVALAGHLLHFAEKYDAPLSKLFGDTTTSNQEERAAGLRWNVLQGLATQSADVPKTVKELAESIGLENGSRMTNNLSELSEIGFVHYEKGQSRVQSYAIDMSALEQNIDRLRGTSREVAQFIIDRRNGLTQSQEYTVSGLAEQLAGSGTNENTVEFRQRLKSTLKNWMKLSITTRTKESAGDARVWVDEGQQAALMELIQIISSLQDRQPVEIENGRKLAQEILSDPNRISILLAQEKDVSVHYKGQDNAKLRGQRILNILQARDVEMTYDEIHDELALLGDIVSKKGIARVLSQRSDVSVSNRPGKRGTVKLSQK